MNPEIGQQMFDFDDSSGRLARLIDSSLKGQIAKLQGAAEKGVARSPAWYLKQKALDEVYVILCDDAPDVLDGLCPRCRTILFGLEDYERC
jgi:hypothetical protein